MEGTVALRGSGDDRAFQGDFGSALQANLDISKWIGVRLGPCASNLSRIRSLSPCSLMPAIEKGFRDAHSTRTKLIVGDLARILGFDDPKEVNIE